ncbi:MAG: hypothetical protein ACYC6Y_07920 [Thermoguttaceae bacterium]
MALGRAVAADTGAARVATVADAVGALDLATFPLLKGAKEPSTRDVARLAYNAKSDCKTAYEFQQKTLSRLGWTELPGSMATDQYASGMFTRNGYLVSVSAMPNADPQEPGLAGVQIMLHGNVDLAKLPVPPGLKATYGGPQLAMYSTDAPVAQTAEECRKRFLAAGWQPYGKAGDTQFFKQNAVRLTVTVMSAPAQGGKTAVTFSSEQLSADVPAPADTVQLQYSDSTKEVLFDTKETEETIAAFYRTALAETGWKATTENLIQIDWKKVLIFRNPAMDMLTLEMYPVKDENVLRVTANFDPAVEVAAVEKRLDDQAAAARKKKDDEARMPIPKATITLPAGANLTEESKTRLEFTVSSGKAQAAALAIRKALKDAGWNEEVLAADAAVAEIRFKKVSQEISLSYVDPGFIPGEFTVTGSSVELEKATGGN